MATPTIVATATNAGSSVRSRSVTFSSWTPAENDLVMIGTRSNSVASVTVPSDWINAHPSGGNSVASDAVNTLCVIGHLVTAAEAAANTLTYTATNLWSGNTTGETIGIVVRGADPADPFDLSNTAINTTASTTNTLAGLEGDNLLPNSLIVSWLKTGGAATFTTPSGWTARGFVSATGAFSYNSTITPPTDLAATNVSVSASRQYASMTVAFKEYVPANPALKAAFFQAFEGLPFPPPVHDAGLNETFGNAAAFSGTTRSVVDYGATPNDSSNDDRSAFSAAIAACSAGDEIYIPDGTYTFKGTQAVLCKSGVKVRGQSQAGVIISTQLTGEAHSVFYVPNSCTDMIFENFTIQRASGSNFLSGIRFYDANTGAGSPTTTRAIVRNVTIKNHQRFGIEANNVKHLLVDGCTISNAVALDGGGSGYGVLLVGPSCHNCIVRNTTIGPTIRHAIVLQQCHHCLIEYNDITGCVSGAIDLHGEDEYSNEVRYNTVHDGVRDGTSISPNGAGIEIGEPEGDHGKSGENNWVHHNEIYTCPQGIMAMNQSNNTIIEDNTIYDCDKGVWVYKMSGFADTGIDRLIIRRNEIDDCINGIELADTVTAPNVSKNKVTNCSGYGITTGALVTKYIIASNTLTGNGTAIARGSNDGTYIA